MGFDFYQRFCDCRDGATGLDNPALHGHSACAAVWPFVWTSYWFYFTCKSSAQAVQGNADCSARACLERIGALFVAARLDGPCRELATTFDALDGAVLLGRRGLRRLRIDDDTCKRFADNPKRVQSDYNAGSFGYG